MTKLLLLDFWAPWCGYCEAMEATLNELSVAYADKLEIKKINIDEDKPLAEKYNILGIPTYVILKEGEQLGRISGYRQKDEMKAFIEGFL